MVRPLRDQVVVVTGASSGIGRATVQEFVRHGARVVAAARNEEGGVLIGISSVEGVRAVPLQAPYVTSKWALRGFYDTIRMEMTLRHPNVKVTTILPASIDTPIFEHALTKLEHLPKSTAAVRAGGRRPHHRARVSSVKERSPFTEIVWQRPVVKRALVGAGLAALGWAVAR